MQSIVFISFVVLRLFHFSCLAIEQDIEFCKAAPLFMIFLS